MKGVLEVYHDRFSGYRCMIKINPKKAVLCGYVEVPGTHPDIATVANEGFIDSPFVDYDTYDVYGGITFCKGLYEKNSGGYPRNAEGHFWVGFDCGHAGDDQWDYTDKKWMSEEMPDDPGYEISYKDLSFVRYEIKKLARILHRRMEAHIRNGGCSPHYIRVREYVERVMECEPCSEPRIPNEYMKQILARAILDHALHVIGAMGVDATLKHQVYADHKVVASAFDYKPVRSGDIEGVATDAAELSFATMAVLVSFGMKDDELFQAVDEAYLRRTPQQARSLRNALLWSGPRNLAVMDLLEGRLKSDEA